MPWKLPLFLPAACGAAPGQSCPGAPCPHSGVLGQSSAPSGQAAWLFLAVVPSMASLLLSNALGAPGLAAPLPFPNTSPSFPCSAEFGGIWGSPLLPGSTGGGFGARGGRAHPAALPRSGWIAALSELHGNLAVAIIMMVVAAFFTLCAVLSLFLLKQVSSSRGWGQLRPLVGHPWVGLLGRGGLPG